MLGETGLLVEVLTDATLSSMHIENAEIEVGGQTCILNASFDLEGEPDLLCDFQLSGGVVRIGLGIGTL